MPCGARAGFEVDDRANDTRRVGSLEPAGDGDLAREVFRRPLGCLQFGFAGDLHGNASFRGISRRLLCKGDCGINDYGERKRRYGGDNFLQHGSESPAKDVGELIEGDHIEPIIQVDVPAGPTTLQQPRAGSGSPAGWPSTPSRHAS